MSMLDNLPFSLRTNIANRIYSGPVTLAFEFDVLNDDNVKPFFFSANIWSRAANAQYFTSGYASTRIDLISIDQAQASNTLTLHLRGESLEPGGWVSLLCQLAQVARHTTALRSITIRLDDLPDSETNTWIEPATQALFAVTNMPEAFADVDEFLLPGNPIYVEIDFERDLTTEQFDQIEKELELWGCLLATGGLRVDLSVVEEPLHAFSFGATSQLTPSWIRYIKQEFDGPLASVALLDHWIGGLIRKGLTPLSVELS